MPPPSPLATARTTCFPIGRDRMSSRLSPASYPPLPSYQEICPTVTCPPAESVAIKRPLGSIDAMHFDQTLGSIRRSASRVTLPAHQAVCR